MIIRCLNCSVSLFVSDKASYALSKASLSFTRRASAWITLSGNPSMSDHLVFTVKGFTISWSRAMSASRPFHIHAL